MISVVPWTVTWLRLILATFLGACAHQSPAAPAASGTPADVVAIVDGTRITRAQANASGLDALIDRVLIRAEARRRELTATEGDIDRVVLNIADSDAISPAQLRARIETNGAYASWDVYREALRDDLLMHQLVLGSPKAHVSEDEVQSVYAEMVRSMRRQEIPRYAQIRQQIRQQIEARRFETIEAETRELLRDLADIRILVPM